MLLSAGVFIKHNLIALPLACAVWLAMTDRPSGRRLVTIAHGVAPLAPRRAQRCLAARFSTNWVSREHICPPKAISVGIEWGARWALALVLLSITRLRRPNDSAVLFCAIYVGVAGTLGLALSGGEGINSNVLFDANWAVCLSAGVALNRWQPNEGTASGGYRTVGMIAAYLLVPVIAVSAGARREWALSELLACPAVR